jgi:hypothetical protein
MHMFVVCEITSSFVMLSLFQRNVFFVIHSAVKFH